MNRSLILVLIPAALVAVAHSAMRWGPRVALPLGVVLAVAVVAAYWLIQRRQGRAAAGSAPKP